MELRKGGVVKLGYFVRRGDAKPGPLKETKHTTRYDEETLKTIDRVNFENWIHHYREIAQALYDKPRNRLKLEKDGRIGEIQGLTKVLRRGVEFGAIESVWGGYRLTTKAEEYYESLLRKGGGGIEMRCKYLEGEWFEGEEIQIFCVLPEVVETHKCPFGDEVECELNTHLENIQKTR